MTPQEFADASRTSKQQEPGFNIAGWYCWTGPSGSRYAAPGTKQSVAGVVSAFGDLEQAPYEVVRWVVGGFRS